jgi:hypothetical protein
MAPPIWYVPVLQPLSQITQFTSADIQIPAQHPINAEPLVDLVHSPGDYAGVDRVNDQVFQSSDRRLIEDRQKRGVREGLHGTVTVSVTQSASKETTYARFHSEGYQRQMLQLVDLGGIQGGISGLIGCEGNRMRHLISTRASDRSKHPTYLDRTGKSRTQRAVVDRSEKRESRAPSTRDGSVQTGERECMGNSWTYLSDVGHLKQFTEAVYSGLSLASRVSAIGRSQR